MPNVETSSAQPAAELFYQDCNPSGTAGTVVLIHGWPLSWRMWEPQIGPLTEAGYRVVAYDRRGFGSSAFPWGGYDYDTLAADLKDLMDELDLRDATLVGFSMGGGEVARYVGRYGTDRVGKVAFVSSVVPFMLQTDDNPDGVEAQVFEDMKDGIREDRPHFLKGFGKKFVGWGVLDHPISEEMLDYTHRIACSAQPEATLDCVDAFGTTDFRPDMARIDVPTLFVHGTGDDIVPIDVSARQGHRMVAGSVLEEIDGAPHGLNLTHPDRFNEILLGFLGGPEGAPARPVMTHQPADDLRRV
ncbi:alpha/beta fold hydrolase [Rubrivirga sp.]|uniref:alpha/beta fold hydrolase n=1 Tax=Rubrivirga sp. TaxID=1885344 RepID=UPI003B527AB3